MDQITLIRTSESDIESVPIINGQVIFAYKENNKFNIYNDKNGQRSKHDGLSPVEINYNEWVLLSEVEKEANDWLVIDYPTDSYSCAGTYYGVCSTESNEQIKTVTLISSEFSLVVGAMVGVKFTNTNTYSATAAAPCQLNVNNTGAKNIYYNNTDIPTGTNTTAFGYANRYNWYQYDGTNWVWMAQSIDNNTTYSAMSTAELTTGTVTSSRVVRSDYLKAGIEALGTAYGTCNTAAATAEKVITLTDTNWKIRVGAIISVKFDYTNTAQNPTFNVNGTGAKSIWYNTAEISTGSLGMAGTANRPMQFTYNGTQWVFMGWSIANTTYTNQSLGQGYGTCTTAATTIAKVVTLSGYNLVLGGIVSVKFTYDVPANATMNINSKGAKPIYYRNTAIVSGVIEAGDTVSMIYDGGKYHVISIDNDFSLKQRLGGLTLSVVDELPEDAADHPNTLYIVRPST